MPNTKEKTRIFIRTDSKLKDEATKVLSDMHLDLSTAINLFLDQVVKQNKLPFEITNETAKEKEIREMIERGVAQAQNGMGMPVEDRLAKAKEKKERLLKNDV